MVAGWRGPWSVRMQWRSRLTPVMYLSQMDQWLWGVVQRMWAVMCLV